MRRNWWTWVATGLLVGLGAVVGLETVGERASAQSGFSVSAEQLRINQRISQASVRRGNRALNHLAPVRTAETDAADDGRGGVAPPEGTGWGTEQIADGAVTAAKLAPGVLEGAGAAEIGEGAVGTPELAGGAVETSKIADGAVTEAKLAPRAGGVAAYAHVNADGTVDESRSRGIDDSNVVPSTTATGRYCIGGLPFEPRSAQASGVYGGGADTIATALAGAGTPLIIGGCPPSQVAIETYDAGSGLADRQFVVWLED